MNRRAVDSCFEREPSWSVVTQTSPQITSRLTGKDASSPLPKRHGDDIVTIMHRTLLLACCLSLPAALTACTSGGGQPVPDETIAEAPGDTAPRYATDLPEDKGPFRLDEPFLHEPSGVVFPLRLATLQRRGGTRYSPTEENFSFDYYTDELDDFLKVTAYVYPVDQPVALSSKQQRIDFLMQHMEGVLGGIRHHYDQVDVVNAQSDELPTQQGDLLWGTSEVTFVTRGADPTPKTSWSYLTKHGPWFVKLRMTAPTSRVDEARTLQRDIARQFSSLIRQAQPQQPATGGHQAELLQRP